MKTLYTFQQQAIDKILQTSGFLLADECGLGKTITAIEVAKQSRPSVEGWKGLVVVPLSLRAQWVDELALQDPNTSVGISNYIPWDYTTYAGWVVATYSELQHGHVHEFTGVLWDIIIADEAHRVKNRKSISAEALKKIPAARRLALTGTPWERSPEDVWSILNFTRPDAFDSYWLWAKEWLELEPNYFEHWRFGGPKDPQEFGEMLSEFMLRRTKVEVREDMPEKVLIEERVEMTQAQEAQYKQFKEANDVVVEVDAESFFVQNALTALTLMQRFSTDPTMVGLNGVSGKLLWLKEFLADHPIERIVVFSRFRDVIERLAEQYKGDMIIGGSRGDDFINGRARLLFGTIDAMGEGLNLQSASIAIFLDAHWSSTKMTQAMDRIHRIDIQESKIIYLLHSCREDKLVLDAIDHKWTEEQLIYYYMRTEGVLE